MRKSLDKYGKTSNKLMLQSFVYSVFLLEADKIIQ